MIAYICLTLFAFVILLFCLYINEYELLSPAPLASLGFFVSLLLACIGWDDWNTFHLSYDAISIVALGLVSFVAAALVARQLQLTFAHSAAKHFPSRGLFEPSAIKTRRFYILIGVVVLTICLRIYETYQIGAQNGFDLSSYSALASQVRAITETFVSSENLKFDVGFSFFERQFEKLVWAIGFTGVYAFASSLLLNHKRGIAASLMTVGSTWAFYLIAGGRGTIMYHIVAFFAVYSIMSLKYLGANGRSMLKKLLKYGCLAAVICVVGMYLAGFLVGRPANSGIFSYVSFYFGGSVPSLQILFDSNLVNEVPRNGINTFYNIISPFYKFGFLDTLPNYSVAWVDAGGNASNIFTCFARYYIDFGLIGVCILSFASMFLLSLFYSYVKKQATNILFVVFIGYLSPYIFDLAREEFFFSRFVSVSQLINLVIIGLVSWYITTNYDFTKLRKHNTQIE